jgi:SAM-dependent methyltransferase
MRNGPNFTAPDLLAEILPILRCVSCRGSLDFAESGLVCVACGGKIPSVNGVLRFVPKSNYADNFGFQWTRFAQTQLDTEDRKTSELNFRERTGFTPEDLAGKLVLDVGCGMGRFAEVATRWGARVVGIDLSQAAEVAAQNLSKDRAALFFQADVFSLPFAPESFDYIYSLGVLHHTPDCEQAFKVLPALLKPGGTIAIWLYSAYNKWYRCSDFYRKFTHRMSSGTLLTLCRVAVPLYHVHRGLSRIPIFGRVASGTLRFVLPTSHHTRPEMRVLDTFDWYSPKYQSKHTYEEVFRWFEACGLESLSVLKQTVSVRGTRPSQRKFVSKSLELDEVSRAGNPGILAGK